MVDFFHSRVIKNHKLNDKFYHITFQLENQPFTFQSGQFVTMEVGPSVYRSYSVASTPNNLPYWDIILDATPGGPGSSYISKLQMGDVVKTTAPRGTFNLKGNSAENILLAANGCGIASIKPMLEELLEKHSQGKVYFYWGLRFKEDIFFEDFLKDLQKKYNQFIYEIILSKPQEKWTGKKGHVTEHVKQLIKTEGVNNFSVYLCGSKEMILDIKNCLSEINFPSDRIYFESYH